MSRPGTSECDLYLFEFRKEPTIFNLNLTKKWGNALNIYHLKFKLAKQIAGKLKMYVFI